MKTTAKNIMATSVISFVTALSFTQQAIAADTYNCSRAVPAPYLGHLILQSKYNTDDPTKSKPNVKDPESEAIQNYINTFSGGLVQFSNYYAAHHSPAATSCLHNWLTSWAEANALTTDDISATGKAVRVWSLSAISSAIFKTNILSNGQFQLTEIESDWLKKLGSIVRDDHFDRIIVKPDSMNNHDYWAAWAAAVTGIITDERDLLDWSYTIYDHAMSQVTFDSTTNTSYFPNELSRGNLGLHYSHFALNPLVMLATQLPEQGYSISYDQERTLKRLVDFTASITLQPSKYIHLTSLELLDTNINSYSWAIAYDNTFGYSIATHVLKENNEARISGMYQLGGDIKPLF